MRVQDSRLTVIEKQRSPLARVSVALVALAALGATTQQAHSATEANPSGLLGAVSYMNYYSTSADNCTTTSVHIDAFAYQDQHNTLSTKATAPYAYVYVANYNRCTEQFVSGVAEIKGTSAFNVQTANLDKGHLTATGILSLTDWTTFQQRDEKIQIDIQFSGEGALKTDKTAMSEWVDPYYFDTQFVERLRTSHVSGKITGHDGFNITLDAPSKESGAAMYVTNATIAQDIR